MSKIACSLFILVFIISCSRKDPYSNWQTYGGNKENNHYSSLKEIDTGNVARLKVAWIFHCSDSDRMTQIQVNPIIINRVLYGVSPKLKLFALNADDGKPIWIFDPAAGTLNNNKGQGYFSMNVCRGLAYYTGGAGDHRIFYSASSNLYCIDADNGKPISSFGQGGHIDLHDGLGRDVKDLYVAGTSPGIIYKDLIIIGDRVDEDAAAAPGHIRAYDVHTGKIRWIFHTIPQPGEPGFESWDDPEAWKHVGGANAWSGFSMDEERGILFASTGSASYDFYGGRRRGDDLYANSVIALDAGTGRRIWHFQSIHHDLWDKDLPTPPVLVTINKDGKKTDALAQTTKSGFVFLFERETGKPIYPIEEKAVPTVSELPGEKLSATQPFPSWPRPFVRQSLQEKDLNRLVPDSSYQEIKSRLSGFHTGFIFNPPSREGTIILPGYDGGGEWGGAGYDPSTGVLYVNANEMAWVLTMVDAIYRTDSNENNLHAGERLYKNNCMSCHGPERLGSGNFPSLIGVEKKYKEDDFINLINSGKRMMPSFARLSVSEKQAIAAYILNEKDIQSSHFVHPVHPEDSWFQLPFHGTGYFKFLTKEGYPAIAPPWGTLNAIDLNTGVLIWKDTLGDYPEFKARGIHTGTENYGGPAVTAGGVLFIAATSDAKFRAFNKRTGQLLWETDLPAAGFATPSIYEVNGRQYVVIACGGGKLGKRSGDAYVAFALPSQ
jgi:quinoprotein glucose dehydrogenase